jgi:hypothetical protein
LSFCSPFRYRSVEHGQFFNENGDSLVENDIVGTENSIDLSSYKDIAKDSIFTHNHPNNGPFSWQDFDTAINFDMKEIRAVAPNGTVYSMQRGINGWNKVDDMYDLFKNAQEEVRNDPEAQLYFRSGNANAVWDLLFNNIAEKIGGQFNVFRE